MPLNLVPNELVGYRFRPDWYSINVVMVKRHGENSKHAGQEYETVLAYCKNTEGASEWLFQHVLKVQGELNQAEVLASRGSVADMQALQAAGPRAQGGCPFAKPAGRPWCHQP
jgi:hypothetical protein